MAANLASIYDVEGTSMLARELLGRPRGMRPRPEKGAVAVEFALLLPFLAMLLLGVITAGIALSDGLGLTNAVREGARFGATAPFDPDSAGDWTDAVIARTRDTQFDDPTTESRVCVDLLKEGEGVIASACDGAAVGDDPSTFTEPANMPVGGCAVRVWAARNFTINAILISWRDRVMARQSIAVYERLPCEAATTP